MRRTLREQYFTYLYGLVGGKNRTYTFLSMFLHAIPFRWSVPNDDNRCADGAELRQRFISEAHLDEDHLEVQGFLRGDCTVFELLVALALRMDDIMYELGDKNNHASRWFNEMLLNLKLAEFTDGRISYGDRFSEMDEQKIYSIVETFMDRTYGSDGVGSLFPSDKKTGKDLRTVEIWYQMMAYLDENYG